MRLPAVIRHIAYNLRGGFVIRPLTIAMLLGGTGLAVSTLEESTPAIESWAPRWPLPSHIDAQVAQVILSGIATSVMTVVSIVFAILLMSLTLASMQFSPRILVTFARDRVTQHTLGIFLGTFGYCIASMPAAHTYPHPAEPVFAVMGAMLLSTLCVVWLLFFIHHISNAISVNHIVDNIARDTEEMIIGLMPYPAAREKAPSVKPPPEHITGVAVCSELSGYIRYVDFKELCAVAKTHSVAVEVNRRVGHFVPAGGVLLTVSKASKMSPRLESELRATFEIGPTRTLQQDIEFGLLQIVDIALRAISPAVNDPTTAITCVDQLSRLLICYAGREPIESRLYDPPGTLRVVAPTLGLDRLIDYAYEQIRIYAKGDLAVSMRLLRALGDVGDSVTDPSIRRFLANWGHRVVTGAAQRFDPEEIQELRVRNDALQEALAKA